MLSWKVGAVTITRVVETEIPIEYDERRPFLKHVIFLIEFTSNKLFSVEGFNDS